MTGNRAAHHPDPGHARETSTVALVSDAMAQVTTLFRKELDLARAEIDEKLSQAATAVGLLVAAVVIALTALNVLAGALVAALAEAGIEPGWAALVVGVLFALAAAGLAVKGANDLKLARLAPSRTTENIKKDVNVLKESTHA